MLTSLITASTHSPAAGIAQSPIHVMLKEVSTPMVFLVGGLWSIFALEIRSKRRNNYDRLRLDLQTHQRQKWQLMKRILPAIGILWTAVAWAGLDREGPSARLIGLNYAFWNAEITLDCALDECGPFQLTLTKVAAVLTMLTLIPLLMHGHAVFWIKTCESLISTMTGRTMDNKIWYFTASAAIVILLAMRKLQWLAPIPSNVSLAACIAYAAVTWGSSPLYQSVQNISTRVKAWHVWTTRILLGASLPYVCQTPVSWPLYDATNFLVFLCFKLATDQVALSVL